ncbi:MAG: DUF401 family protein [candidate division Zixibacteria bacterium]|nr:DUF401 family protein [candidate division Zixibacteria bacterium]
MVTLKLLVIFVLILVALRQKVSVGITLFGAGLLTVLLYRVSINDVLNGYWTLMSSQRFIALTAVICLITTLGSLLKELGFLQKMSSSCRGLYGGSRTAATILPPLVGLMPMPGGALLSAPLVDEVLADPKYTPAFKCATNYWFRHVVEHFMPIYPGMILTEAVTGLPVGKIAVLQSPLALAMIVIGVIFFIRKIDNDSRQRVGGIKNFCRSLGGVLSTLWPVVVVLILYGAFKINMALAAMIAVVLMVIVVRPPKDILWLSLKRGFSYKLVFLVFGILSFQTMLDLSGAIASIEKLSSTYHFPEEVIIILVCFTAGILTGMYAAFVALSYSLLAGFLYQPEIIPGHILLAFISGYIGMILSPTHLCLIVTNNYFKSDLIKVLKMLIIPALLLGIAGYLLYLSGWSELVYP